METQCCIAGGGPAGMMLGYLLARAGVDVVVLEKHADFLRDFRGDTVHPSTLQVMADLGLLDEFLKLPHSRIDHLDGWFGEDRIHIADFSRLNTVCPYIALMPQWDFLNFLVEKGRAFKSLHVLMSTKVTDLVRENDRVVGVKAISQTGEMEIRAQLTVGADGRHSTVRAAAQLAVQDVGSAIDVLWFRIGRDPNADAQDFGHIKKDHMLISIDRDTYWQCAYVIRKGDAEKVKAQGIEAFRQSVVDTDPALAGNISDLQSFDDVKLLTVGIDRLNHWSIPGLLCIGDAAHTMSPVGGVGINLALQDAVATANLLAEKLRSGTLSDADVEAVQRRREWPARAVQAVQRLAHHNLLEKAIRGEITRAPLFARVLSRSPWLQGRLAAFIGLGVRQERVSSPRHF
ncbi:MAG: FAD-dependent oxidoreductase [Acidobacteria bacterium]|nr:FAD-dependent oxidoreductase [Acidobacteriota bacterium]